MEGGTRGEGGDTMTSPTPSYTWLTWSYSPMGGKGAALGNQWPCQDRAAERSSTLALFKEYDKGYYRQWQQRNKCDDKENPSLILHPPPLEGNRYRMRLGDFGTRLTISMHNHDENRPTSRDVRQGFQEEFYSGSQWRGIVLDLDMGEAVGWRGVGLQWW